MKKEELWKDVLTQEKVKIEKESGLKASIEKKEIEAQTEGVIEVGTGARIEAVIEAGMRKKQKQRKRQR